MLALQDATMMLCQPVIDIVKMLVTKKDVTSNFQTSHSKSTKVESAKILSTITTTVKEKEQDPAITMNERSSNLQFPFLNEAR